MHVAFSFISFNVEHKVDIVIQGTTLINTLRATCIWTLKLEFVSTAMK